MPQPIQHHPQAGLLTRAGTEAAIHMLSATPFRPLAPALGKWFTGGLDRVYSDVVESGPEFFRRMLANLDIKIQCAPEDVARIPKTGPLVLVANHPFGLAEGILLGSLLTAVRPDVKFLANSMLMTVPQLQEYVLPVNPFGGPDAIRENLQSLRRSLEWLKAGHALVIFPAGEVSSLQLPKLGVSEKEWTVNVARLALKAEAPVLPLYFHGSNSATFHLVSLVHERLRTVLLPKELLNKAGSTIRISVGTVIPSAAVRERGVQGATEYLRARTMLLESRAQAGFRLTPKLAIARAPKEVVAPRDAAALAAEVEALPESQKLVRHGEYTVFVGSADQLPTVLAEIGRLREVSFRSAGEGTGEETDLDWFDRHYEHLVLWNREKQEIVGAYRLGRTDKILRQSGMNGLYTSTLFRLDPAFCSAMNPALELGRSFVRPEYQRSYVALLLLWKGLGQYVVSHPEYRHLFGPVSISNSYQARSRALMVSYLKSRRRHIRLSSSVKPKKAFRVFGPMANQVAELSSRLNSVEELSDVVSDLEPDRKGVPVLLNHYLNLGGRILEFSVDKKFSNVADALILVDLMDSGRKTLERYMGKGGAESFVRYHSAAESAAS